MASPWMNLPGAVGLEDASDPDVGVPFHFGSPLREQLALAEGRAVTALARDVVAVSGPDRLSWLTTLSSQILTGLKPGDGGAETLLLDAQGHVRHALAAVDDGEVLYLVAEAGRGADLAGFLESMRFMLRVQVQARPDLAVLGACADGLAAVARLASEAGAAPLIWKDPWPGVTEGGTSYDVGLGSESRPFRHPGRAYAAGMVIVSSEALPAIAAGMPALAGSAAWEALRVEAGRPRQAREVDERTIPHEWDWLRTAVHLTKGCYPGQETIARTLNLGRPPRRAVLLQLDGLAGDLPPHGAAVRFGGRIIGQATTVVRHHDYGPMALALVRRNLPLDAPLTVDLATDSGTGPTADSTTPTQASDAVGNVAAAQEPLVSPEGKAGASPAERPGAGLRSPSLRPPRPADKVEP